MPNPITPLLSALAECLRAEAADLGWCGVLPGDEAVAQTIDCDAGGMGWVRLTTSYPASSIGTISQTPGNMDKGLGLEIEMGIMRCVDVPDPEEVATEEQSLVDTERQLDDMLAMQRAIQCCSALPKRDYILGQYAVRGPLGGVLGGTWLIYTAI